MIFGDIYADVVNSFGSLWNYKERGDSLEIVTPFATTSHKFVSVFIARRGEDFIVSDGGWIAGSEYGNTFDRDISCYDKAFLHYIENFQVKETYGTNKLPFFYKKTNKGINVPSLILDMSNFISTLVSLSDVEYEVERKPYDLFSRTANEYLSNVFVGKFEHGVFFDLTTRHVKPSAIITKENGRKLLLNYVTGSTFSNFQSSIAKTSFIFELAEKSVSLLCDQIENKITLIDDTSSGYDANKAAYMLDILTDKPRTKRVDWSRKEELLNV